ncbi:MAG: hypothetical protein AB1488_06520 [Nitrospirota bacterium]
MFKEYPYDVMMLEMLKSVKDSIFIPPVTLLLFVIVVLIGVTKYFSAIKGSESPYLYAGEYILTSVLIFSIFSTTSVWVRCTDFINSLAFKISEIAVPDYKVDAIWITAKEGELGMAAIEQTYQNLSSNDRSDIRNFYNICYKEANVIGERKGKTVIPSKMDYRTESEEGVIYFQRGILGGEDLSCDEKKRILIEKVGNAYRHAYAGLQGHALKGIRDLTLNERQKKIIEEYRRRFNSDGWRDEVFDALILNEKIREDKLRGGRTENEGFWESVWRKVGGFAGSVVNLPSRFLLLQMLSAIFWFIRDHLHDFIGSAKVILSASYPLTVLYATIFGFSILVRYFGMWMWLNSLYIVEAISSTIRDRILGTTDTVAESAMTAFSLFTGIQTDAIHADVSTLFIFLGITIFTTWFTWYGISGLSMWMTSRWRFVTFKRK